MPIWLRKYTFNEIKEYFDKKSKTLKEAESKIGKNKKKIPKAPSYNTKARK